jgi:hypothetical protein
MKNILPAIVGFCFAIGRRQENEVQYLYWSIFEQNIQPPGHRLIAGKYLLLFTPYKSSMRARFALLYYSPASFTIIDLQDQS